MAKSITLLSEEIMDVLEAIHTRHSIGKVKPDPLAREVIEQLLLAGVQAPNHYNVRPWRFVVLTGAGREKLGDVLAESFHQKFPDVSAEALNKERAKSLRSPLLIAVGVDKPSESRVSELENICAVASACENILLAAHALGLGAQWRTGDPANDPNVKKFLGFAPDQHILAFLYIGHPADASSVADERPSFEDRTTWIE
jgi:nitroreductase